MSGHLIGCAGALDDPRLGTSHKLALLAFADSADDRTHIAFPGYEGVQRWANCSRGRAAELIKDLAALGYLEQHKRGHRGQRAEYVVFPGGCCELHRTPTAEPPLDVAALAAAAGVTVDQARILLGQTTVDQADVPTSRSAAIHSPVASGTSDATSGTESDTSDPFRTGVQPAPAEAVNNHQIGSGQSDPITRKGPERVHGSRSNTDAFTTSKTSPHPPPSGGAVADTNGNEPACPRHTTTPGTNCRACGTSPRTIAAKRAKAKAEATRKAEAARFRAERDAAEAARNRPDYAATVRASLATARAQIRAQKAAG